MSALLSPEIEGGGRKWLIRRLATGRANGQQVTP